MLWMIMNFYVLREPGQTTAAGFPRWCIQSRCFHLQFSQGVLPCKLLAKIRGGASLRSLEKNLPGMKPSIASGVGSLDPFISTKWTVFCRRAGVEGSRTHANTTSFPQTIMHPYHSYSFKNVTKVALLCGPYNLMWLADVDHNLGAAVADLLKNQWKVGELSAGHVFCIGFSQNLHVL